MISFKGKSEVIRNADRITRLANYYPHVRQSYISEKISDEFLYLDMEAPITSKLRDLQYKYSCKIDSLQFTMTYGMDLFRKIIDALKNKRIGNCYESARMAEIIAKINGQNNIYPMRIFVSKNSSGAIAALEHVVSVITDKVIEPNVKYSFKNNEAVILDPWLGITEYVSHYLEKIKYDFKNMLPNMPNVGFSDYLATKNAKNLKEYKKLKKNRSFNPDFRFELHYDDIVSKEHAKQLKKENPDLVIDNFKNIVLHKKKEG